MSILGMISGMAGGLLSNGLNAQELRHQNEENMKRQIAGNKEMGRFNQDLQKEMWEYTGYGGQMRQLKEAGLNPGLLYGKGGGGGQTIGGGGASVGMGATTSYGDNTMGMVQASMQNELLKAQKENIEADTRNKEADTGKKGVEVESITQGIENQKAQERLLNLQNEITEGTKDWTIGEASYRMQKAGLEVQWMVNNNWIDRQTADEKIGILESQLVGSVLSNDLMRANIAKTKEETRAIGEKLVQAWKDIELRGEEVNIKTFEAETKRMYPGLAETGGNLMQQIFNKMDDIMGTDKGRRVPYKVNERK